AYALGRIHSRAVLLDGMGGLLGQQSEAMGVDDVLFASTFEPYARETAQTIEHAAAKGTPVVVLTDSPLSPAAAHATVCLEVHDAKLHNFRSLAASMCLAQALVVAVGLNLDEGDVATAG